MIRALLFVLSLSMADVSAAQSGPAIGSKRFTEGYILGEIARESMARAGLKATHKQGLGSTGILFEALNTGSIDVYADYTGTIARELLKIEDTNIHELRRRLEGIGLSITDPLGFENTYAIALLSDTAEKLGIDKISDLAQHSKLKFGFSPEFINRDDGWVGLRQRYALPQQPVGIDHGIVYEAIAERRVDAMDIYSTDAKIEKYRLKVLKDDRRFFPDYSAVFVYRLDLEKRFPRALDALRELAYKIDAATMIKLNARAELEGVDFSAIAKQFLDGRQQQSTQRSLGQALFADDLPRLARQHVLLVLGALITACIVGVPLGIWATRSRVVRQPIFAVVELIQTIPSIALLAFLIPLLGAIGTWPALVALFLYSLLPIVRNTAAGLESIPRELRESADALGLSSFAKLRRIELPLATRTILSGIKTSAVLCVGTATIAAFIGAGGFGERISAGLALNNNTLLLAGALPAALLALIVHIVFDVAERWLVPKGIK